MIAQFHITWGFVAVAMCGVAGLWGVVLAIARRPPNRPFTWLAAVAIVALVIQVGAGLLLLGQGQNPGTFHVFYGVVILFTLSFAYIYRAQLAKRPTLGWGLLLLFLMGLGIRAIGTMEL